MSSLGLSENRQHRSDWQTQRCGREVILLCHIDIANPTRQLFLLSCNAAAKADILKTCVE